MRRVDPMRVGRATYIDATGIKVRGTFPDGRTEPVDIAELTAQSLRDWLRMDGGDNVLAEGTVAVLLGHNDGIRGTTPDPADRLTPAGSVAIGRLPRATDVDSDDPLLPPDRPLVLVRDQTNRGFEIVRFDDLYGQHCSLQKSSLAGADAVWLGVDDIGDQMRRGGAPGVPRATPARMHLTRNQVATLLPDLVAFALFGEVLLPPEMQAATIADDHISRALTLLKAGANKDFVDLSANDPPVPSDEPTTAAWTDLDGALVDGAIRDLERSAVGPGDRLMAAADAIRRMRDFALSFPTPAEASGRVSHAMQSLLTAKDVFGAVRTMATDLIAKVDDLARADLLLRYPAVGDAGKGPGPFGAWPACPYCQGGGWVGGHPDRIGCICTQRGDGTPDVG